MKHGRIALGCLPLLAACAPAIPPLPQGAAVAPPAGWRTAVTRTAPAQQGWWRLFGDPVLDALVEQALADNTDIATAAARVREARAQEALVRSQRLPSLDLGVGAARERTISPFGTPTTDTAVQPVFQRLTKWTCSAASAVRWRRRGKAILPARRRGTPPR